MRQKGVGEAREGGVGGEENRGGLVLSAVG